MPNHTAPYDEAELIARYPMMLVNNYCVVASSMLLWYDCILTFPEEYRRMWKRKFTGGTAVYFLVRYTALLERVPFLLEAFVWHSSDQGCGYIMRTDAALSVLNYFAMSALVALRVYGVWGGHWKLATFLLLVGSTKGLLTTYMETRYTPYQAGTPFGCLYIFGMPEYIKKALTTAARMVSMATSIILIVSAWIKTFGIVGNPFKSSSQTPLATLLLRDGTMYFLSLLVVQIPVVLLQLSIPDRAPGDFWSMLWLTYPYFEQVIIVIVHVRFMLDLRGLYVSDRGSRGEGNSTLHLSEVRFAGLSSTLLGNLGATLQYPGENDGANSNGGTMYPPSTGDIHSTSEEDLGDEAPHFCNDPFRTGLLDCARDHDGAVDAV